MVSLLDIAPSAEKVVVRGQSIEVKGISAKGVAIILGRFPIIREIMAGVKREEVTANDLIEIVPDAVACIIAAGTGFAGNEKAEEVAANLSAEEQADLIAAILRLTMPSGIRPFVEKLGQLGDIVSNARPGDGGKAQGTKSPKQ